MNILKYIFLSVFKIKLKKNISKIALEKNLKTYYKLRGWDWETGAPTNEKLIELGINPIKS